MIDFLIKYNDVLVFLMVVLSGYAGAYTCKGILRERFIALHAKYTDRGNVVMCYRCWEPYPCADLKILGIKK